MYTPTMFMCTSMSTAAVTLLIFSSVHVHVHVHVHVQSFSFGQTFYGRVGVATTRTRTIRTTSSVLCAKNKNKHKKRPGYEDGDDTNNSNNNSPRGGGRKRRGKRNIKASSSTCTRTARTIAILPEPSKLKKRMIQLQGRVGDRTGTGTGTGTETGTGTGTGKYYTSQKALSVCTVEVDDVEWWEDPDNQNPYGGRLWPSAVAISEFLIAQGDLDACDVLELGCGAGLVSIVAAECGAHVIASDISPTIVKLCQIGWLETQRQTQKQKERKRQISKRHHGNHKEGTEAEDEDEDEGKAGDESNIIIGQGSLQTSILDIFSKKPLPTLSNSSTNQKIVIATTMMYEPSLAAGLAHRAFEACESGAWVIIGDDDTGERDGGRNIFISELDRLQREKGREFQSIWTDSVVKSKELQWNEKRVKILHLNAPADIIL